MRGPSASEGRGNDFNVLRTFTGKPRPESRPDCLICATFARRRGVVCSCGDWGRQSPSLESSQRTHPCRVFVLLWSERGTYKTVKARFWPWLRGTSPYIVLSCPPFARKQSVEIGLGASLAESGEQPAYPLSASEGRGNDLQGFTDFYLKEKARIWP